MALCFCGIGFSKSLLPLLHMCTIHTLVWVCIGIWHHCVEGFKRKGDLCHTGVSLYWIFFVELLVIFSLNVKCKARLYVNTFQTKQHAYHIKPHYWLWLYTLANFMRKSTQGFAISGSYCFWIYSQMQYYCNICETLKLNALMRNLK